MMLIHEFKVELDNGKQVTVEIEAFGEYDDDYGARLFFVTDESVLDVNCDEQLNQAERGEACALALKKSCEYDWESDYIECSEGGEPEDVEDR